MFYDWVIRESPKGIGESKVVFIWDEVSAGGSTSSRPAGRSGSASLD